MNMPSVIATWVGVLVVLLVMLLFSGDLPAPAQLQYEACVETGESLLFYQDRASDRLEVMCWEGAFLSCE